MFRHSDPKKGKYLVLTNSSDSGMFAVFGSVLGALNVYEKGNYPGIKIDLNSGRYLDVEMGANWWEYFFEPIVTGNAEAPHYTFTLNDYLSQLMGTAYPADRHQAHKLIQKYVHLKPHIQQEIDAFVDTHFKGHYVIGVHHRGTDKIEEWPLVAYEKTFLAVQKVIESKSENERTNVKIYVATDDQHFVEFIEEKYPGLVVYNDFSRSQDNTPLHAYNANFYKSNYQMGKEALLDCILLSKTDILIRPTSSCLSSTSIVFNPDLPVIGLSGS